MTWLVAGFGDLGQTIVRELQNRPETARDRVIAVKRSPPIEPLPSCVTWLRADLSDPRDLQHVPEDVTHAVFCAAPDQRSQAAYEATYRQGAQNLALALRQRAPQARLLFVSSTAVYGSNLSGLVDEDSPTEPTEFNGRILLETENWLRNHDPRVIILRLSGIYGPNRQMLLQQLRLGKVTVPESPDYWANRIHVDDAARAVIHLLCDPIRTGVYVGTDSTPLPLKTLYSTLAHQLGAPTPAIGLASPMMGKKQLSNQKLRQTGFDFTWPDCRDGYKAILARSDPDPHWAS